MRPGISTSSFYPRAIEEVVAEFAVRNISPIEIFVNTLSELQPEYLRELRRILDSYGGEIVSLHPFTCAFEPFMLFTRYERRFRDAVEWHKNYFEAMNRLGAGIFVFHGDRYRGDNPPDSAVSDEEYYERFAVLRDLGKSFGIIVAQENVERCRSRSLDFLRRMVDYLDGDVAFVFDNKQALRSGVDYRDFIETLGERIVHVHLSDNGPAGDCLSIGDGTLDLQDFLGRLRSEGYDGSVMIELYRERLRDEACIFEGYERLKAAFSWD